MAYYYKLKSDWFFWFPIIKLEIINALLQIGIFFYCKMFTKYFSSNAYLLINFISFLITSYVKLLQILKPQQLTEFTQYGIKILLRLQKKKQ